MLKTPFDNELDDEPATPSTPTDTPSRRAFLLRGVLVLLALFLAMLAWATWKLPLNRALEPLPDPTLVLVDRHGAVFARRGALKEAPVDVANLPEHVAQAVIAIEDRRFYGHVGVDPRGIARAAVRNAKAGGVKEGGSTITQQLAKTAFLEPERTFRRKIREALIALWLDARLEKDEILSRYLSSIYFGDGVYGLRAASKHYFDKEPEKLSLGESAMLAGMIKAPSALAPTNDLKAAQARAKVVLAAMVDAGFITEAEAKKAREPRIHGNRRARMVGSWFADWVSPQAKAAFDADYGEIRVQTTLDRRMQQLANRVVTRWLATEGRRLDVSQAALVAMRPNGEILAHVGGRDYKSSQYDRVTQAKRQPGSAFKLFTALAALRAGATPETMVDDRPVTIGDWSPENYDGKYDGAISLRAALAKSSNVVAARIAQQVGPGEIVRAARDLGIESELSDDATIALGTSEVTLLELTAAYAGVASGIAPVTPHGLLGAPATRPMQPLDHRHRAMLLDMLWEVVDRGTGRAARLRMPTFGKTGTTQDYRDALFVGMAGDLVVGVWVGNDDGRPMKRVTGGGLPAQMWRDFMDDAVRMSTRATRLERPRGEFAPVVAMPAPVPGDVYPMPDDSGYAPVPGAEIPVGDPALPEEEGELVPVPEPAPEPPPVAVDPVPIPVPEPETEPPPEDEGEPPPEDEGEQGA
ncbi:transglycosylase domain-containing protein [Lysobacter humi (ex Lee et al. 2017)]